MALFEILNPWNAKLNAEMDNPRIDNERVMAMAILGPSFPDLQMIYQISLSQVSFMMLVLYLGTLLGGMGATYIFSSFEAKAVISACLFISGVTLTFVPVTDSYVLLMSDVFCLGVSVAVLSTGGYCQMHVLWPSSPKCFHVLGLGFAIGGIISPLLIVPFLSDARLPSPMPNTTHSFSDYKHTPTVWNPSWNVSQYSNDIDHSSSGENDSLSQYVYNATTRNSYNGRLLIPYALLGSLNIIPCGIFVYLHISPKEPDSLQDTPHEPIPETPGAYTLYSCTFVIMLVMFTGPAYSIALTYGQYLVTFGLGTDLNLSVQTLSEMTGTFWLSMLCGKITVICLSKWVSQVEIIFAGLTGLSVTLVLLYLWAVNSRIGLWITSIAFGLMSGYYFNCIAEWGRQVVEFSPFIMCLCCFGDRIGTLIITYLCGILMDTYGYIYFGFVLMLSLTVMWILMLCMCMLSRILVVAKGKRPF